MRRLCLLLAVPVCLLAGMTTASASIVYRFEGVPLGTSTPFSVTKAGVTATFSSSTGDPCGFAVEPGFFAPPFSGNILVDPGSSGLSSIPLDIVFSAPVTSISVDFATDGTSDFVLTTAVGSASTSGAVPPGYPFPQGTLTFSSATPFTMVELTAPSAPFFAIDNVTIAGAVPEPGSLVLLGLGGVGALTLLGRRKLRD